MINLPDKIQASTQGFAIANAKELGGHRQVANLTELYTIPDAWLSESKTNANDDAIGQHWWVQSEEAEYRLTDWDNRNNADGWEVQTVEIEEISTEEINSLFNQ